MKFISKFLAISVFLFPVIVLADSIEALQAEEIQQLISGIQSDKNELVIDAAKQITASGITSDELYDAVDAVLLEYHNKQSLNPRDEELAVTMLWLLRAIGSSGDQRFTADLYKILNESKSRGSRNRAKHMLGKLSWYEKRNKAMQDLSHYQEGQSLFTTRYLALLDAEDPTLSRWAAEELYRQGKADPVIIDKMMQLLRDETQRDVYGVNLDRLAWFCRCSARYGAERYQQDIQALIDNSSINPKIRKHCRKELKLAL